MSDIYNSDIATSILSSIVFKPSNFEIVNKELDSQDFYLPSFRNIYNAIKKLVKEDKPIDEEFIKRELVKINSFDEQTFLTILSANPIGNLKAYIEIEKENSRKRKLLSLASKIQLFTVDINTNSSQILKYMNEETQQINSSDSLLTLVSLGSVVASETEFILKEWLPLPKGAVVLLSAGGGIGKSFIVLQAGLRYLKENINHKVFMWLSEDDNSLSKHRATLLCNSYDLDKTLIDRIITSSDMPVHFTQIEHNKQSITSAFYLIKTKLKDYDFIIFDPLIAFFSGDENNNSHAKYFMQIFAMWAREEKKVILFIHHGNRKDGGSRGASAFVDAARLNYSVNKISLDKKSTYLNFTVAKDNYNVADLVGGLDFKREVFPKNTNEIILSSKI
jgi:replicative DNA helicase